MNKKEILSRYIKNSPLKWQSQGFAMLPHSVMFDERLCRPALSVFWILTVHLFRGKQNCFPSLTTISKESRYSRPTVIKAIKDLEEFGHLKVVRVPRKANKYYLQAIV